MYCRGLGLRVMGHFENHEGFDGVMLGFADSSYHFEFPTRALVPSRGRLQQRTLWCSISLSGRSGRRRAPAW